MVLRTLDEDDTYHCNLICGKTRVVVTIPRLQFCVALLLDELMEKVKYF